MKNNKWYLIAIVVSSISHLAHADLSSYQFEEVSAIPEYLSNSPQYEKVSPRGIGFPLESWGSSWGDLDRDGYPDLWSGNHRKYASLYRNNRDGTFTDLLLPYKDNDPATQSNILVGYVQPEDPTSPTKTSNGADSHGAAWADFDGDGDMDLIEQTGGVSDSDESANQFFINFNGRLVKQTHYERYSAVRYPQGRGRSALWFDYDNDSRLDLFLTGYSKNSDGISTLFRNTPTIAGFVQKPGKGFDCPLNSNFTALADMNEDGKLDLICHHRRYPQKIFDVHNLTQGKFTDLTPQLFDDLSSRPVNIWDAIIGDFDGDLVNEIVAVATPGNRRGAKKVAEDTIHARLAAGENDVVDDNGQTVSIENGIDFMVNGRLEISITSGHLTDIYIGRNARSQQLSSDGLIEWKITLNPANIHYHGLPDVFDKVGLYIGIVNDQWAIRIKHGGPNTGIVESVWATFKSKPLDGTLPRIGEPQFVNFQVEKFPLSFLNKNANNKFIDDSAMVGLDELISCVSVTAGDFDNDMDLDLYLVCEETPANIENILYENLGDNDADGFVNFAKVDNSGGAAGTLLGDGKVVAMADYDVDGFLDLFVSNGNIGGSIPNGPDQLFRNRGNENNWIELDLNGQTSNPHGIGARIEATTAGTTQLREMNGGAHNYVQDHQRVHFGLANNTTVDLVITWPSGTIDTFNNVVANSLYRVTEGGTLRKEILADAATLTIDQDECGLPYQDKAINHGVFLWKSCTTNNEWHLRATGGGIVDATRFKGNLFTDMAIANVTALSIEADDTLNLPSTSQIDFELNVNSLFQDGFDFTLASNTGQACLDIAGRDRIQVLLGGKQKAVKLPFDLTTLKYCETKPGDECGNPSSAIEPNLAGIFLWKNCFSGQWTLSAQPGGSEDKLTYTGSISSSENLTDIETMSIENNDSVIGGNTRRIQFSLKTKGSNRDRFRFNVNNGQACIAVPELPAGTTVRLGENQVPVKLPINTSTLQSCN